MVRLTPIGALMSWGCPAWSGMSSSMTKVWCDCIIFLNARVLRADIAAHARAHARGQADRFEKDRVILRMIDEVDPARFRPDEIPEKLQHLSHDLLLTPRLRHDAVNLVEELELDVAARDLASASARDR